MGDSSRLEVEETRAQDRLRCISLFLVPNIIPRVTHSYKRAREEDNSQDRDCPHRCAFVFTCGSNPTRLNSNKIVQLIVFLSDEVIELVMV